MTKKNRFATIIPVFLLALVILFSFVGGGTGYASAETSSIVATYEQSNVLDDLNSATIDGESIDLKLYNFDESKNAQIVSFVEFGYSYQKDKQGDFGLYLYVYNPRGYDWTKKPELNKISLRYGGKSSANFNKYYLQYLNRSTAAGYEGLFYKFKIVLSSWQREAVLAGLNSNERIYEVSEIELYNTGTNATAYNVSNTYKYKGFAQGYGSASATENTLSYKSGGLITLTLDVHGAVFRPDGNNGKNEYTQDMLHSVYFSIPNEIISAYDRLSAVHATWLNALTAPIFVTGNQEVYDQIYDDIFNNGGAPSCNTDGYALLVNAEKHEVGPPLGTPDQYFYTADLAYNVSKIVPYATIAMFTTQRYGCQLSKTLNNLNYCFLVTDGVSADEYELKGSTILEYMQKYSEATESASELVAGKYNSQLFESWDSKFTDINIKADYKYSLKNETWSQGFFDKLFGTHTVEVSKPFNGINAIHEVQASDFKSKEEDTCKNLYIDQSYYDDFKAFYDKATKADETVYLFRYYQSEYVSKEVTECSIGKNNSTTGAPAIGDVKYGLNPKDTNAYLAQEVVNLDFDIIDVTCSKGEVETVIPCVSSPKDLVPSAKPPLKVTGDPVNKKMPWWGWLIIGIVGVIALLIILSIAFPQFGVFMRTLINGVFGWLNGLFNSIAEHRRRKRLIREEKRTRREYIRIERYQNKLEWEEQRYRNKLEAKDKRKAAKKAQKEKAKSDKQKNRKAKSKSKKAGGKKK